MGLKRYEQKYDEAVKLRDIETRDTEKSLTKVYLKRARSDLFLARLLMKISQDENTKKSLLIDQSYHSFHWVIVSAYYAMYHAATSAIAQKGIKARTHVATVAALAKHYALGHGLAKQLEDVQIQHIDATRITRQNAQYKVTKSFSEKEAERVIDTAQEFIDKIDEIIV